MVKSVVRFTKISWNSNTLCGAIGGAATVPDGCNKSRAEYDIEFTNLITQWYCHHCAAELVAIW